MTHDSTDGPLPALPDPAFSADEMKVVNAFLKALVATRGFPKEEGTNTVPSIETRESNVALFLEKNKVAQSIFAEFSAIDPEQMRTSSEPLATPDQMSRIKEMVEAMLVVGDDDFSARFGHFRPTATELMSRIRLAGEKDLQLSAYLKEVVAKFSRLGCKPSGVEKYVRSANRCLESIYLEARSASPSPLKLLQLALRFALDARKPIVGDVRIYRRTRVDQGWCIVKCGSLSQANSSTVLPGITVTDWESVMILNKVSASPPSGHIIISFVETILGYTPGESGGISREKPPRFWFRTEDDDNGNPTVQLWIGDAQVELKKRKDIHQLLTVLCESPKISLRGPQAKVNHGIANASSACSEIRKSLEKEFPGAGDWLQTDPIQWAQECAPKRR